MSRQRWWSGSLRPEARIVALVAALQFVYIVDFMAMLPLAPDAARALGFTADRIGWLSAAYTLGSVAAGLLGLRVIDRVARKPALLVLLTAFGAVTWLTTRASSFETLLAVRAVTGFIGGPMVALAMATVIDATPPAARGRAIARVMLGFSLAAIAGVPFALELARWGVWSTPFEVLAGVVALLVLVMAAGLPRGDTSHGAQAARASRVSLRTLWRKPVIREACGLQAVSQFSAFLLIPSFSAFYLLNLQWPRQELGALYLAGGVAALVSVQLLGRAADRWGAVRAVSVATVGWVIGLAPLLGVAWWPHALSFVCFMAGNAGRNITLAAATSQAPAPHERAAFMSLQGMVQDVAIALAGLVAAVVLRPSATGALDGMGWLAGAALVMSVALPAWLQRGRLHAAQAKGAAEAAPLAQGPAVSAGEPS